MKFRMLVASLILFAGSRVLGEAPPAAESGRKDSPMIQITSSAFTEGAFIPKKHTCDGEDVNPPLAFTGVPANAQCLALIVDDPDAPRGTWNHWLLWNIDPETTAIAENSSPAQAVTGNNDFLKTRYNGPCPPKGVHRYFFKLFALDHKLKLKAGASRQELDKAMEGHILAWGQLMGKYAR